MKHCLIMMIISFFCISGPVNGWADDLLEVYQQALSYNPVFQKNHAEWLAAQQLTPISRAAWLPQLNVGGFWGRRNSNHSMLSPQYAGLYSDELSGYQVDMSQTLWDAAAWHRLRQAKWQVKAAHAIYLEAKQALIMRTAKAYFSVLEACDRLTYLNRVLKAVKRQYYRVHKRYKVGLSTQADWYAAHASYDRTRASCIEAKNVLLHGLNDLQRVTGKTYKQLASVASTRWMPPSGPVEAWVHQAVEHNFELGAMQYNTFASHQAMKVQSAAYYPTWRIVGEYSDHRGMPLSFDQKTMQWSFQVHLPLWSGGETIARVRQARYIYEAHRYQRRALFQGVVTQTRQTYRNVVYGIHQLQADHQAVISQKSALESRLAGYRTGVYSLISVLDAETDLCSAQQKYSTDQYRFLLSRLQLQALVGRLTPQYVVRINHVLQKPVMIDRLLEDRG